MCVLRCVFSAVCSPLCGLRCVFSSVSLWRACWGGVPAPEEAFSPTVVIVAIAYSQTSRPQAIAGQYLLCPTAPGMDTQQKQTDTVWVYCNWNSHSPSDYVSKSGQFSF